MKVTIQRIFVRAARYIILLYTRNQRLERHGHAGKGKAKWGHYTQLVLLKILNGPSYFHPFNIPFDWYEQIFVSLFVEMHCSKVNFIRIAKYM